MALSLSIGLIHSPGMKRKILSVCLAGSAVAMCCFYFYGGSRLDTAQTFDGKEMDLKILVVEYGTRTDNGAYAAGQISLDDATHKAMIFINQSADLQPGDYVHGTFYLSYQGYDGNTRRSSFLGEGVYLKAYATGSCHIQPNMGSSF